MHTFVCIVGLPYRLISLYAHDIICVMYACINVLTKLMYFQQIIYLLGVKIYMMAMVMVTFRSDSTSLVHR